ncbi:hypothetical protein RZS08_40760, partial [Arthrospira platensis SPKY1]|nr:hypothetical protein [Arthrospira platensis SPKY1]
FDCFFIINLQKEDDRFYIQNFSFTRTTVRLKEILSKDFTNSGLYLTSHVNGSLRYWADNGYFINSLTHCFGNFAELSMLPSAKTVEDFVYTFLNMIHYVSTESESGGPYYRIKKLTSNHFYTIANGESKKRRVLLVLRKIKQLFQENPSNAKNH